MKQETLEETAERHTYGNAYQNFIRGANWQMERSYSEEEVYNLLEQAMKDAHDYQLEGHYNGDYKDLKKWFEQFKKK